jgi:hypothetical protein
MINLPEEVIIDLLPAYFSNEASETSRAIIDAYFLAHPEFAATMRASQNDALGVLGDAPVNSSKTALTAIKSHLIWRSLLIACGVFFILFPFSFRFRNGQLEYFALRDNPLFSLICIGISLAAWITLYLLVRRMNSQTQASLDEPQKKSPWKLRAALIAIGIFCSASPFSFTYENSQFSYLMWRDESRVAFFYIAGAVSAWIALWLVVRRQNTA